MATTKIDGWVSDNEVLGYSSGTTLYTIIEGQPVCKGTDGASVADRVKPVADVTTEFAYGIAMNTTAEASVNNNIIPVLNFPCKVKTTNVDPTLPPVIGARVYLLNSGLWSNTDTNTSDMTYGLCTDIIGTEYILSLNNPVDLD